MILILLDKNRLSLLKQQTEEQSKPYMDLIPGSVAHPTEYESVQPPTASDGVGLDKSYQNQKILMQQQKMSPKGVENNDFAYELPTLN